MRCQRRTPPQWAADGQLARLVYADVIDEAGIFPVILGVVGNFGVMLGISG
jgi:hypothetical protein